MTVSQNILTPVTKGAALAAVAFLAVIEQDMKANGHVTPAGFSTASAAALVALVAFIDQSVTHYLQAKAEAIGTPLVGYTPGIGGPGVVTVIQNPTPPADAG